MTDLSQFLRVSLNVVVLAIMLVGELGLIIPILPGLAIIWVAGLVYGVITGFTWVSGAIFAVMTLLMVFGSFIDNIIMGASARQTGASWVSIAISLVLAALHKAAPRKEQQGNRQHTIDAEKRAVPVIDREVGAVFEVVDHRKVDQEAEDTCA